jgi:hypothetical protein
MKDNFQAYVDEIVGARFVFVPPGNFTMEADLPKRYFRDGKEVFY